MTLGAAAGAGAAPGDEEGLRRDARRIVAAGLAAVDPARLVADALGRRAPAAGLGGRLTVVAVGKAALGMAEGAMRALGRPPAACLALVPGGGAGRPAPPGVQLFPCGHPLPDEGSVGGSRAVLEAVRGAGRDDRVLLLLSGGASACLTLPADGVGLEALRALTADLLRSGAAIEEVNAVRKHLEALKGGRLARAAAPARVTALVLSDVIGDRLDVIGSGPVSADPSTFADAIDVLARRGLLARTPGEVRRRLEAGREGAVSETPKAGDPCFDRVEVEVIGNGALAVEGARAEAERLGYRTAVLSTSVAGEAREVGARLAAAARGVRDRGEPAAPPACLLACGETTVRVVGDGRGGRNQEVALGGGGGGGGVGGALVASIGTDGVDGPTDTAGAVATGSTLDRAAALGLDPRDALGRNDAYPFFRALDDLVVLGPTGTNVMDLMLVLVAPPGPAT